MVTSAASSPPGSLPTVRSPLVGRQPEIAAGRALLLDEAVPLLTLTGPGGIGKTRLALAIANQVKKAFADGVAFVDLAELADPALVLSTAARAVGASIETSAAPDDLLSAYLRPRQLLLVLDNCEHLLEPVAELTKRLLGACPAVQVMATSRAPLRLHGEHELRVPPLSLGSRQANAEVEGEPADAVTLFVQRARAAKAGFVLDDASRPAVVAICHHLDGLPLAIELAASWTRILSPDALLARLADRLLELTGGTRDLPARQQSLRETIAWSHALLSEEERILFRRLGVFAGGFDLEAVEGVAGGGRGEADGESFPLSDPLATLAALVEQSLVQRDPREGGETRFVLLEALRVFAEEQLAASGEAAAPRESHARHFLALAEEAAPHLRGPDQFAWFDRLDAEHPNLREAMRWYREEGDLERALRLAAALGRFWEARGYIGEGRGILEELLESAQAAVIPPGTLARALSWAGTLTWLQGDFATARERHEAALARYHEAGDERGIAFSLNCVGAQHLSVGDVERAEGPILEALARYRKLGDAWGIGFTANNVGIMANLRGDQAAAEQAVMESLTHYRLAGDAEGTAHALINLGFIARARGEAVRAEALLQEAVAGLRAGGHPARRGVALLYLGYILRDRGEWREAAARFGEALGLCRDLGDRHGYAQCFEGLAPCLIGLGLPARAVRLLSGAAMVRQPQELPMMAEETAAVEGASRDARAALGEEAFAAAWQATLAVPVERLVAEALDADFLAAPVNGTSQRQPADAKPKIVPGELPLGFDLTRREREVLGLLCQRYTDPEIAEQLFISPSTASRHVSNIYGKLGVSGRREAAAVALRHGLI
jgi:non-specific serine/threonine protein kinase